jgi:Flp pilus assembly protein TadB
MIGALLAGCALTACVAAARTLDGASGWPVEVAAGGLLGALVGVLLGGAAVAVLAVATGATAGGIASRRRSAAAEHARRRRVAAAVPGVAELLGAAIEAGAPTWRALAVVGAHTPGDLGVALVAAARDVESGRRAGAGEALLVHAPGLVALASLLRAGDDLGTPLAEELRLLATDERDRRVRDVRLRAAAAGPRMMLVIGALLAPAALLVVVGGEVLTVARALGSLR